MPKAIVTPQGEDFPRWYQDVVAKAELADNGPVRGTMVIRPWAYAMWERIQREVDDRLERSGVENAYFPLLIPESFLRREAEHVEGFSPELAVVTHGGGKELEEPAVVRPTSETIINHSFARWIQSYRDLPMLVNNWSNVVRWELRPRLFLRTTEFLWQEGHTCHETAEQARDFALEILDDVYVELIRDVLALPVLTGFKTPRETFAGATRTWTCESLMLDGKALQMGTSHELGQNFSKVFGTVFSDREGVQRHPWQTSWAVSTRLLGALVMAHGDDRGLRLPPAVAPRQVVVVAIRDEGGAVERARSLFDDLYSRGVRVALDDAVDVSFGRRVTDWELKGVPVRLEVGPRDLAEGNVTLALRASAVKRAVPVGDAAGLALAALASEQAVLHDQALAWRDSRTAAVATIEEAIEAGREGFAVLPAAVALADGAEDRLALRGVTLRCVRRPDGAHTDDLSDPDLVAVAARAY